MSITPAVASLLQSAMRLRAEERAELAGLPLESLVPRDAEVERLWLEESHARLVAYEVGELDSLDAESVFAELPDGGSMTLRDG
jgi:hypothetical protein